MPLSTVGTEGVADASIKAADLNADVITGMTAASPAAAADDDVILMYDTSASALRKVTRGNFKTASISALNDITNVTITSIGSGEVLKWNGSAWINNTLAEAGIAPVASPTLTGDVTLTGAASNAVWDASDNALEFADNAKATFGASADLSIYHDGTNSYIKDSGTGNITLQASQINMVNAAGTETIAQFNEDGSVFGYYDNAAKITTTATGATITGTLVATTDTDTSNSGSVTLDFAANQNFVLTLTGNVTLANPSTEQVGQSGIICCIQDGTGSRTLSLGTDYETAGGAGITLSTAANAVDIIPYFVKASGSIQLGAVQLAFS